MSKTASFFAILFFGALVLATQALFIVPETQQVIVFQFGEPKAQYPEPGLKFKVPFIQNVKTYDSRVLDVDPPPEEVILSDQKRLVVDTFARYRIVDMLMFYQALGTENQAVTRLHNLINSSVRSALGNVDLTAVLSERRADIMTGIKEHVNQAVERLGLEIVDVRIGRADLPDQTSQAIYARMRSEREREAAEFRAQGKELAQQITARADKEKTVILAEAEKQAQTARGRGDEAAIKIYADAFKRDPEFYSFYRSMEAYRKGLTDEDTTFVLSPESEFFRFFEKSSGR